jgi:hypothetical protein
MLDVVRLVTPRPRNQPGLRFSVTKSRLVSVVVSLGLIGAAAGCGGQPTAPTTTPASAGSSSQHQPTSSQKIAYEQAMKKLGASLGSILAHVGASNQRIVRNTPNEQKAVAGVALELRKAQLRLRQAATKLAAMKPPADVKSDHEALRRGVLDYAAELDRTIARVRTGNFAVLRSIARLKGIKEMDRASLAITRKGYAIL